MCLSSGPSVKEPPPPPAPAPPPPAPSAAVKQGTPEIKSFSSPENISRSRKKKGRAGLRIDLNTTGSKNTGVNVPIK